MKIENHGNIKPHESSKNNTLENNKDITCKKDSNKFENNLNNDKTTLFKNKIIDTAKISPNIDSKKILELKNTLENGQYKINTQNLANNLIKNHLKDHFNI